MDYYGAENNDYQTTLLFNRNSEDVDAVNNHIVNTLIAENQVRKYKFIYIQ